MPKPDAIDLLRGVYNKNAEKKSTVRQKGNDLYFDRDVKLPLDTETAWQAKSSGKQYNLGSLWLALELHC